MSFLNIPDVFIGSTDDGHTFVVLNRRLRDADRMLTDAGFLPREHLGRKLYLLPPGPARDAHESAGDAMDGLLTRTIDIVDLSWTTRWNPDTPEADPDLRFQFANGTVTATAETTTARSLLEQHGFTAVDGSSYQPPPGLEHDGLLGAVTAAEAHAYTHGLTVHVGLGIPTPMDIPAAPRPASPVAPSPPPGPATRRRPR
ncbi:hypothetical protein [Streptomyces sp. WAC01526]|uniref:hypothetical protein n=1 Tax=Streptomyces sp. WAC01526 TaxID=2588709 RepID=UPI0011E05F41|nr:hypothetical protein [Streptomyces sp. WAC01526]